MFLGARGRGINSPCCSLEFSSKREGADGNDAGGEDREGHGDEGIFLFFEGGSGMGEGDDNREDIRNGSIRDDDGDEIYLIVNFKIKPHRIEMEFSLELM